MPSATTATTDRHRPATAAAWLVVLVVAALALIVLLGFAFSTENARGSIDGRTATTSQFVEGG